MTKPGRKGRKPAPARRASRTSAKGAEVIRGDQLSMAQVVDLPPSEFPEIADPQRRAYLVQLSMTGKFADAAAAAGVSLRTGWNWRHDQADPAFLAAIEVAVGFACDRIEAEITRRAIEGVDEPVYQGGKMVGVIRKFSDTLLIFAAKGAMPQKYRERYEHTGKDGSDLFAGADDRLARLLVGLTAARDAAAVPGDAE